MKIVLLGPAYPYRGGIAQFLGVLAESLQTAGHEVHVVNFKKQFPRLLFPGKTQYDESPERKPLESARTFVAWNPLSWLRTAKEIARHDPDLILVAWWMPFFGLGYWGTAKALPRKYRNRIQYLLHNVVPHERRIGDLFLSRLALNTSTYYIPLSKAVEKDLFEWFPKIPPSNVKFSPHPIYDCYPPFAGDQTAARQQLELDKNSKLLLFFGFIREYKGLDIVFRAMPSILKNNPGTKLVVAGEFYQDRGKYDDLIQQLNIGDAVIIRDGYITAEAIGTYFAAADCVVLPYRTATQSGIIQIAYALDMPVITTDVGGLAEVVMDGVTGLVVPPENPERIADAVTTFYAKGGRAAFLENIRRERDRYSWHGLVKTITGFGR
jgi:D-inositol-3-phosphate glycosyltransferase